MTHDILSSSNKQQNLVYRYLPILAWLPHYDRSWLMGDVIAGLSVWALTVPASPLLTTNPSQASCCTPLPKEMCLPGWMLRYPLPLTVLFDHQFLSSKLSVRYIVWLAVAYGLVVVQGVAVLQTLAPQLLQEIWWMRLLLSQSFVGAVLLLGLALKLRIEINETST